MQHATPVDEALPFLAVVLTVLAALKRPVVQLGVPLLMVGEIAIPDERMRLLWFGIVMAGAFVAAVGDAAAQDDRNAIIALLAILVLRWIPFREVMIGRELALLAIAAGIVWIFRATPLAVAIAVLVTLLTPAVPMRTLGFPLAVLLAGVILRVVGMPAVRAPAIAALSLALPIVFFAWSGVFARALPVLLRGPQPERTRLNVAMSPRGGEAVVIDLPQGNASLIVSGANMPRLRHGTPIGRIEPGGRIIRIGDAADWGSLRREHYYNGLNSLPRDAAGKIHGYGQTAWIDGAGRIALPFGAKQIVVTADRGLPPDARLQLEAIEIETP